MRQVLANSVPKAGTHLLKRCLALLPGLHDAGLHLDLTQPIGEVRSRLAGLPAGGIATGHLVHGPDYATLLAELGLAHLLMLRDPRDVALSLAEYIPRLPEHYLHARFQELSPDERLEACIVGLAEPRPAWDQVALRDVAAAFRQFLPWAAEPGVLVVRFEELVGPSGGGSPERQRAAVAAIAERVGVPLGEAQRERVAQGVFDPGTPTFREGAIGGWRARYRPEHVRAFKRVAGELLLDLGYEQSPDW